MGQEKANKTILCRLGAAAELVNNYSYLPKFRNRQKQCEPEQWSKLVETAKTKQQPQRWFAAVCSCKNWQRTLKWLKTTAEKIETTAYLVGHYFGELSREFRDCIIQRLALLNQAAQMRLYEKARTKRQPERYLFRCLQT